jgi:hypothetical protein
MRRFAATVVPVLERECEELGRQDQLVPVVNRSACETGAPESPGACLPA